MAASASTTLFSPCALTSKLGAGHASYGSVRRANVRRRGRLSVVAVQTGPQKPSPLSSQAAAAEDEADALQKLLKREYKYGVGEFYSVALTKDCQQADTGTKMIHKGKNSRSRIISKGISAGKSRNCYRGLVLMNSSAENAYNSSQCDSLLIGDNAAANTYPTIQVGCTSGRVEHEASTSKIGEDQLFYFQQRGVDHEKAVAAMIGGFCRSVFEHLPYEFAQEVDALMNLKLEGSVG
ncbi:UPF0051 protein ABCI8 chloroplastic [Zea mays]|uniref:UPF0051 protein ABCI8 chloroplastic n=1 Tax=Zea mays TaxID=4577 RepID=A0A1D6N7Y2_MAIZE|nr:UPF0051 protein ABCI8 chloroplastic [Zea mays]